MLDVDYKPQKQLNQSNICHQRLHMLCVNYLQKPNNIFHLRFISCTPTSNFLQMG